MKTHSLQDKFAIDKLGSVCSIIEQLPTSIMLSSGLEKLGTRPFGSGGLMTDTWQGKYNDAAVAIIAFRGYDGLQDDAKKVKKVSAQHT